MFLSKLQKYILIQCRMQKKKKINKNDLFKFYNSQKRKVKDIQSIVTKSLVRLIKKELISGMGSRTPHKWYLKEIKLTAKGKKMAKKILGEQQRLPI